MKKSTITLVLLLLVLTVSFYYFYSEISTERYTPPIEMSSPSEMNIYGEVTSLDEGNGISTLGIYTNYIDWEINSSKLEIKVNSSLNVSVGEKYAFYFTIKENGTWQNVRTDDRFATYRERGKTFHKRDLSIDQMIEKSSDQKEEDLEPNQKAAYRIIPENITEGKTTELDIKLINNQDQDIEYNIDEARILNEEAFQHNNMHWQIPPYEQRVKNSTLEECKVDFDGSESVIEVNSTKILTFEVTCPEGVNVTKEYMVCDNYESNENCIVETTSAHGYREELLLWGEIRFVDELGNVHTYPDGGILKQYLHIERK